MSTQNYTLADRMKRYEQASKFYLTRRIPVIIRLDGKAFHTFTKGLKKPFDDVLNRTMQKNYALSLSKYSRLCIRLYPIR